MSGSADLRVAIKKAEALQELIPFLERSAALDRLGSRFRRQGRAWRAVEVYLDRVIRAHFDEIVQAPELLRKYADEFAGRAWVDAVAYAGHRFVTSVAKANEKQILQVWKVRMLQELSRRVQVDDRFLLVQEVPSEPQAADPEPARPVAPVPDESCELRDDAQPSPILPREALERIAAAERAARAQYDQDKLPYFPTHPEFRFHDQAVFGAMEHIIEYLGTYARQVVDARLKEHLDFAPDNLLSRGEAILDSVQRHLYRLTNVLWEGYWATLAAEPGRRSAHFSMAVGLGTIDQHPYLEPWRYPEEGVWADFLDKCSEPNSEISKMHARYQVTLRQVIQDRILYFRIEARKRLGLEAGPPAPKPEPPRDVLVTHEAQASKQGRKAKKLVRRNQKYEVIDKALREIADSRPSTQEEILQSLDGRRVVTPPAEPFMTARGWMLGFKRDAAAARSWLSKRWAELDLPSLPRGPKK